MGITLYLLSQRFTELMFGVIAIAYFFSPIFLIVKLAKSKRIGRVKKIIFSVLIVVVFLLITNKLLIFIGNEVDNNMINDPARRL